MNRTEITALEEYINSQSIPSLIIENLFRNDNLTEMKFEDAKDKVDKAVRAITDSKAA